MITESAIYWILKLDDIKTFFWLPIIICAILSVVFLLFSIVSFFESLPCPSDEEKKYTKFTVKFCLIAASIWISLSCINCFIPSTKQMAMIKVIPAITNSEFAADMSKDAKELYKMGIEAIKEQLTNKNNGETSK